MVDAGQVHRDAKAVLDFWFGLNPARWWQKDAGFDAIVADRFGALRDRVVVTDAAGWCDDADTLLAAVVLTDQFSRNIHRGHPQAFAADDLAVRLTLAGIGHGWQDRYPCDRRIFFYMPLMHAEDMALQALSVDRFERLGIEENAQFARDHRDVIARFGRFPARNAALGRVSTAAEQAYLDNGGGW